LAATPILIAVAAVYSSFLTLDASSGGPFPDIPGEGYFVVTNALWAGALMLFAAKYLPRMNSTALAVLVLLCGILLLFDFHMAEVTGAPWGPEAEKIAATPVGHPVTVAIAPRGWQMTLIRK